MPFGLLLSLLLLRPPSASASAIEVSPFEEAISDGSEVRENRSYDKDPDTSRIFSTKNAFFRLFFPCASKKASSALFLDLDAEASERKYSNIRELFRRRRPQKNSGTNLEFPQKIFFIF